MAYPSTLQQIVHWLLNVTVRPRVRAILKLVFQGAIYFIWRERNSRLHSGVNKPATQIVKEIQVQIRAKLLGMDKENSLSYQVRSRTQESFIFTWFDQFQAFIKNWTPYLSLHGGHGLGSGAVALLVPLVSRPCVEQDHTDYRLPFLIIRVDSSVKRQNHKEHL
ncbi:hypothetical protein YC2023_122827 [Brassica napus]